MKGITHMVFIFLFSFSLSAQVQPEDDGGDHIFENSRCETCQFNQECNDGCGEDDSSSRNAVSLLDGPMSHYIDGNYDWDQHLDSKHYFVVPEEDETWRVRPFIDTDASNIENQKIKIKVQYDDWYVPGGLDGLSCGVYLDLSHIPIKNCTLLIESNSDLVITHGLDLDNSLLILKTTEGRDIAFQAECSIFQNNDEHVVLRNNSELRIFSGNDVVFNKKNQFITAGDSEDDDCYVKMYANHHVHIRETVWFIRNGFSQFEWNPKLLYIIGEEGVTNVTHYLKNNGYCKNPGGTCGFMSKEVGANINIATASLKTSVNIKAESKAKYSSGESNTGYSWSPSGSLGVDGGLTLTRETDFGELSEYNQMMTAVGPSAGSWAPVECGDVQANFDYNIAMRVSGKNADGSHCDPDDLDNQNGVMNVSSQFRQNLENTITEYETKEGFESHTSYDPNYFVYPNPIINQFTVVNSQGNEIKSLRLLTSDFKPIYTMDNIYSKEFKVRLSQNLVSGIYLLVIIDETGRRTTEALMIK